jgi:hypothetical protein
MLTGLCKSSINARFQALGYASVPMSPNHAITLTSLLPFLAHRGSDFRQWAIKMWHPLVPDRSPLVLLRSASRPLDTDDFVDYDEFDNIDSSGL